MGYKSQVTIAVVAGKDSPVFNEADPDKREELNGIVYYQWEYVKWYYDIFPIPSVAEVMEYLDKLEEEEYGYYRIGEDDDDVESRGSPYELGLLFCRSATW